MTRQQREVLQTAVMVLAIFAVMIYAALAADKVEAQPHASPKLAFGLQVDVTEQPGMEYDLLTYQVSVTNQGSKAVQGLNFWGYLPQQILALVGDERTWLGNVEPATIEPVGQPGASCKWTFGLPVTKISELQPPQLKLLHDSHSIMLMVEAEGLYPTQYYFQP